MRSQQMMTNLDQAIPNQRQQQFSISALDMLTAQPCQAMVLNQPSNQSIWKHLAAKKPTSSVKAAVAEFNKIVENAGMIKRLSRRVNNKKENNPNQSPSLDKNLSPSLESNRSPNLNRSLTKTKVMKTQAAQAAPDFETFQPKN